MRYEKLQVILFQRPIICIYCTILKSMNSGRAKAVKNVGNWSDSLYLGIFKLFLVSENGKLQSINLLWQHKYIQVERENSYKITINNS